MSLPYLSRHGTIKMYTIISPPGYHGILGRKIQKSLEEERTKRCLKANVKQFISKKENKDKNQKEGQHDPQKVNPLVPAIFD